MLAEVTIGLCSISDRASSGVYQDQGIPALAEWLGRVLLNPIRRVERLIPDEQPLIERTLEDLVDREGCCLVLTTGGTGFSTRDVTPEATLAVADRLAPGIPEAMRYASMQITPRGMLSRSVAGLRGTTLIINLPGSEKGAHENLDAVLDTLEHALNMVHGGGHENSCKSCADN